MRGNRILPLLPKLAVIIHNFVVSPTSHCELVSIVPRGYNLIVGKLVACKSCESVDDSSLYTRDYCPRIE